MCRETGLSARKVCDVLEVNRSTLYRKPSGGRPSAARAVRDAEVVPALKELAGRFATYGYRRLKVLVSRQLGRRVNAKRVRRLMREQGLFVGSRGGIGQPSPGLNEHVSLGIPRRRARDRHQSRAGSARGGKCPRQDTLRGWLNFGRVVADPRGHGGGAVVGLLLEHLRHMHAGVIPARGAAGPVFAYDPFGRPICFRRHFQRRGC